MYICFIWAQSDPSLEARWPMVGGNNMASSGILFHLSVTDKADTELAQLHIMFRYCRDMRILFPLVYEL